MINQAKTKITKPVSIEDVRQVLAENSHYLDVLCTSGKINKYSAYKPIKLPLVRLLYYSDFVGCAYGLKPYSYQDTNGNMGNFVAMVNALINAGDWDGIVYDQSLTYCRLADFADAENSSYGYDETAVLLDEYYDSVANKTHFIPSNIANMDFSTQLPADSTIADADWANIANSITSVRNHKDVNIFDILANAVAGGTDTQNIAAMANMKHGIMLWHDSLVLYAFNTIPWTSWRDTLATELENGTSVTFRFAEFYTNNTNMHEKIYLIPRQYGSVVFTFDYGVSILVLITPNGSVDTGTSTVTLRGKTFGDIPSFEISYGYIYNGEYYKEIEMVTNNTMSSANKAKSVYYLAQNDNPTQDATHDFAVRFYAQNDVRTKNVILNVHTGRYLTT